MSDLFGGDNKQGRGERSRPLADRLRPQTLDDIAGQDHLTGPDGVIREMLVSGHLESMILWGPPGCGKTTLARIIAKESGRHFEQISAIFSGIADLRAYFEAARIRRENGVETVLFVDEIHRFNKAQQDAFLPVIEDGTIVLIGATTENPSFELNDALLSRAGVFVMRALEDWALEQILRRAEDEIEHILHLDADARVMLKTLAHGDGRYLLGMVAQIMNHPYKLDVPGLLRLVQRRAPLYDKSADGHYNLISALHKSVRGSDPDAALYWLARMIKGGEDPEYIARRVVRMASEDVGLADPQALPVTLAAWDALTRLGAPEGELMLAQAVIYVATAPKSNAAYTAWKAAQKRAEASGAMMPPKHILNAPTKLMGEQGYGDGYIYDHDTPEGFSGQHYFPDGMARTQFYDPPERGFEREIRKRLAYWAKLRGDGSGNHGKND